MKKKLRTTDSTSPLPDQAFNLLTSSVGHCLLRVSAAVMRRLTKEMKQFDLSLAEFTALLTTKQHLDISQTMLADAMKIDPSRVVLVLDSLEKKGLVERTLDPSDRRVRIVQITNAGYELLNKVVQFSWIYEELLVQNLNESECELLVSLLNRLHIIQESDNVQ